MDDYNNNGFVFLFQSHAKIADGTVFAMRVASVNAKLAFQETNATCWPVTSDVRNMDNVKMGRVSVAWDGMGGTAPYVSGGVIYLIEFIALLFILRVSVFDYHPVFTSCDLKPIYRRVQDTHVERYYYLGRQDENLSI